jgi:phosphohistidine phosphatase
VPQFNVIYTSPYVRARQTAEIVAEAYGNNPPCRDLDALQPGADLSAIKAAVKKQPSSSRIALVGHEPDLSELISLLVTGSTRPQIEMKKGAVCRVDIEDQPIPGSGVLVWLLPAKILQMIK